MKSIFNLEKVNDLIEAYDGNWSVVFPYIKDKFMNELINNPKSRLHDGEEGLFMEFAFFENDYLRIKKDLLINNINSTIVDIGCQLGLQSELFLDMEYVGVEHSSPVLLNEAISNVNYIKELFPCKDLDISDKVVISNMSLGFFNSFINKDCHGYKDKLDDTDLLLIEELSKAKILYCNSRPIFVEELKKRFSNVEFIFDEKFKNKSDVSTGVYKFYN